MKNILVLGGTGFVGRAVCERLVERSGGAGGRIVVPTRRLQHGQRVRSLPTLDLVQANVHDDAQLARLVAQADAVINLVAVARPACGAWCTSAPWAWRPTRLRTTCAARPRARPC